MSSKKLKRAQIKSIYYVLCIIILEQVSREIRKTYTYFEYDRLANVSCSQAGYLCIKLLIF